MKKITVSISLLAILILTILSGCGEKKAPDEDTVFQSSESVLTQNSENVTEELDLTKLSSTMVYSEVYMIMSMPEEYIGRTIRVNGKFVTTHDDNTKKDYFAVLVADAMACCQQGIEFSWSGEHNYPSDYPAVDTEIEICGKFESYVDTDGQTYYHIVTDEIKVIK